MRWNVAMAVLAASWGLIAVIAAAVELDTSALAFLRLALGATALVAAALLMRAPRVLDPRPYLAWLLVLGVVQGGHWLLFFAAIKLGSVALAVLTFYAAPLVIAVAAPAMLGERVERVTLVALLPGLAGVGLIAGVGDAGAAFAWEAIAAGLAAAVSFAVIVLLSRRLVLARAHPLTVASWNCSVGAAFVAPWLVTADAVLPRGVADWLGVLALGIVFTGASTLAHAALLRKVTAQTSGVLTFLEPVVAVLVAAAVLDEKIGLATLVGGALIVGAGLAVVYRSGIAAPVRSGRE